ncbi:ABC transporter permease [Clostridium sp.]|uniref:ABC transporter permease n=1 Tax=Clostridium sp. TaxID=1506 RepID=UPI00284A75E0|nr:ABC transporter permease [Clostridium sp.]MDR3595172.1 ABC transporter permease [Clostridium sp.]
MLGKLMKYEIKATGRILIPLYIALLAFALINKVFIGTGLHRLNGFGSIPFILSIFAYGATMAAVFIVTFFIIIQRFYKNLLGDEGYLMNTLPVSTISNITSKLSIATFWNIISGIVAILSIIIMAFEPVTFANFFAELFNALSKVSTEIGGQMLILIVEVIVAILISLIKSVTMIYASISIGHLFSKHKILSAFGAFIVLNIITGAISAVLGITFSYSHYIDAFQNMHSIFPIHMLLIFGILFNLLFFIIYFIITNYILKNKLNLE